MQRILARAIPGLCFVVAAMAAHADPVPTAWTDWKKDTATAISGQLVLPGGTVTVKYSGPRFFRQLGAGSDHDYWTSGIPDAYAATGRPTGTDIIGFAGGTGDTEYRITFSQPVANPVFAILSLGAAGLPARYVFKQAPVVLSSGVGFYGGCADCLQVHRKTLTGTEGHGIIQFIGTFKSITWTEPDYENWHAIQVGAPIEP